MAALMAFTPAVKTDTHQVTDPGPLVAYAEGEPCGQWWHLAQDVGWPAEQMSTVAYVMHRESRCNPDAYNSQSCGGGNHAIGLMQLCGWGGRELFDPETNLRKALELWQRSGWRPWCLPRDPVTRC